MVCWVVKSRQLDPLLLEMISRHQKHFHGKVGQGIDGVLDGLVAHRRYPAGSARTAAYSICSLVAIERRLYSKS